MSTSNQKEKMIWPETLEDFYGVKLDTTKAIRWTEEIKAQCSNLQQSELIKALRWSVTGFNRSSKKARPDLSEVINMVKAYRGDANNTQGVPNTVLIDHKTRKTTTMADLKFQLQRCDDPVRAWEIITTPAYNADQAKELEDYAEAQNVAFERFIPPAIDYTNIAQVINESEPVPF